MRISDWLNEEIGKQPHHVRAEFWAVHDQLAKYGAPSDAPQTRPLGPNGRVIVQVVDDQVDILYVEWPPS